MDIFGHPLEWSGWACSYKGMVTVLGIHLKYFNLIGLRMCVGIETITDSNVGLGRVIYVYIYIFLLILIIIFSRWIIDVQFWVERRK